MQIKVLLKKKKEEVGQILEAAIYLSLKLCCQFSLGWRSFFKQFGDAHFIIFAPMFPTRMFFFLPR